MPARLHNPDWVPAASDFPAVFTLAEFQRASHHALGSAEIRAAYWWVYKGGLLEARRALGPIRITSYARTPDNSPGCHENRRGDAIDLVPVQTTVGRLHRFYAELSDRYPRKLGEVLDETRARGGSHLHLTRWPCGVSDYSEILRLDGYDSRGRAIWSEAFARPELLAAVTAIGILFLLFFA